MAVFHIEWLTVQNLSRGRIDRPNTKCVTEEQQGMKNVKMKMAKAMAFVLSFAMIIASSVVLNSNEAIASTTTSWNFKNSSFKNLGTISSTVTVDGLGLIATSSKTMSVIATDATVGSTSYTHALSLGGSGSLSYRAVKVPVSGNDVIKVTLKSSGSANRSLVVADASGNATTTLNAGTSASTESTNYSGNSGYVYLYSADSGINIYKIQVDSKDGASSSSSSTSTTESNYLADGWYYIKNINSQKYVEVVDGIDANGANVQQFTGNGYSCQKWYLTNQGNNYITLKNGMDGGRMMDVTNGGTTDGTNVQLYDANGLDPQVFKLVKSSTDGAYCLLTKCSGETQAVDVYGWSTADKGNINTWTYNGLACQQFRFEATENGTSSSSSSSSSSSTTTNTSDGVVVSSFNDLVKAVANAEKAGGGKIYVSGKDISCTAQLALSKSNANVSIIGVQNSDGTYPVLDFSSFREAYIGKSTSDAAVGIRITGSGYTLQNLIVEKAPDNGIQIKGTSAGNNTVYNCITRYNNDAGLQITAGAYNNTIKFVYSYRNCDVYTIGGNADGFAPKLGAGSGNTFYGCYAWDNSDDGWDSYDKSGDLTPDLTYTYCACWNNGNPDVFTGKYDYDKGNALDEDLLLVYLIEKQDSSFAKNYAAKKFSLPTSSFIATQSGKLSPAKWTSSQYYDGNPNGFKLGSAYSSSKCVRTLTNCLTFEESSKGFDNNNSAVTGYFKNCIAYDNGYNYYIAPLTIKSFSNVLGFSGSNSDKLPSGYSVSTPSSSKQSSIRSSVESTRAYITSQCKADKIPGEVYFNIF